MCENEKEGRVSVSRVVLQQGELLRAVIQFLQETGLVHSMRALEKESGLTAEPLSVEMYCLRDMALRGQWHQLFKFLSPLEGIKGVDLQGIKLKVCKQEFLEQLRASPADSNTFELVEHYKGLVLTLQQLATLGLSETDHRKLSLMLTLPESGLQQEFKNWSMPASRLQLADDIMQAVSKVIGFRGEEIEASESNHSESDPKKENKGRLIQLAVKGLLYEKCEKILLNDSSNDLGLNSSQSLDLSSLLPKFEDNVAPFKLLEIVCEEDNNNLKNRKGAVLSPLRTLYQMRDRENLKYSGLPIDSLNCVDKQTRARAVMLSEERKTPNGFTDEKLVIKLDNREDLEIKADGMHQSLIHNEMEHFANIKPPLAERKLQSFNTNLTQQQNTPECNTIREENGLNSPQLLVTPQVILRTKDIPAPGCDSSTPKPDRVKSALTLMPNESPIQPTVQVPTGVSKEKHTQSLNGQQLRQHKPIVRKLDMDGTDGSNDSTKAKQSVSKVVDASNIPKAVQWMVGMGRDKLKKEGNTEVGNEELEMNREIIRKPENLPENLEDNPVTEKKTYQLVVSDEGNVKSMENESLSTNSYKFQLPFIQLVGQLKDTQVIRSVCFNPVHSTLAVGTNSRCLYLCQYTSSTDSQPDSENSLVPYKTFTHYHKGSLYCVEWSPQGSLLASASNDQSIRVLKFPTEHMQESKEWEEPIEIKVHTGTVRALGFLSEELLASGGAGDSLVRIVDLTNPTVVIGSLLHGGQINEVYPCSEHELVTASQDELVRVWDIRSCECVWKVSCPSSPSSICSDKSETRIAASCEDGRMQIYDRRNSMCFYSNKIHQKDIRSIRFKPATSDTLLTGSYDGEIKLTYPDLGISHQIAKFANKIIQCRFSPDANWMVSSSTDKSVKLWEFSNTF